MSGDLVMPEEEKKGSEEPHSLYSIPVFLQLFYHY